MGIVLIGVLVVSVLPFPLLADSIRDYSRMHELMDRMTKENDAILCHQTLSMFRDTPNFTPRCNDEYYREDDEITHCCGLSIYQSTYREYLQTKRELMNDLPKTIVALIWILISAMFFHYALIDAAVSLSKDGDISLRKSLNSALKAFPALLASEVFWKVAKNNTGGYIVLGLVGLLLTELSKFQSYYYFGTATLLLSVSVSIVGHLVNSLGGLWVYLSAEKSEERAEEKPGEELL
ncbi:hypothetical protein [Thermococcus stetteri]|uniref:hypothetical protein n=1 Tax=Thermococcus stetteri TaxID=49900 RepID=UPI001AE5D546|nr:hypothetical protein [Thermococcus stetteri]MBP1912763.1 hypothetical protein [Thermococcus stetteri]